MATSTPSDLRGWAALRDPEAAGMLFGALVGIAGVLGAALYVLFGLELPWPSALYYVALIVLLVPIALLFLGAIFVRLPGEHSPVIRPVRSFLLSACAAPFLLIAFSTRWRKYLRNSSGSLSDGDLDAEAHLQDAPHR